MPKGYRRYRVHHFALQVERAYRVWMVMNASPARARRTTYALKSLMAVSGLLMILWLLAHMYGNLKIFEGQTGFDSYAEHLRTLGTPILPTGGFLWISRFVLTIAVFAHFLSAVALWKRDHDATGGGGGARYEAKAAARGVQRTYSSYTLRYGGLIVLAFIVFHLLHLSSDNVIHPGGASDSPYRRVVNGFGLWYIVLAYAVPVILLGMHIRHGVWSALTTLGANNSPRRRVRLNQLSVLVGAVLAVGFLIPPFSVLFGWVN